MNRNEGVTVDTLFVGPTRPTTIAGVTWQAFVINIIVVMEAFIWTQNLLWLLLFIPIHGICYLICLHDPRTFELLALAGQTKGAASLGNLRFWGVASFSPLRLEVGKKATAASRRRYEQMRK